MSCCSFLVTAGLDTISDETATTVFSRYSESQSLLAYCFILHLFSLTFCLNGELKHFFFFFMWGKKFIPARSALQTQMKRVQQRWMLFLTEQRGCNVTINGSGRPVAQRRIRIAFIMGYWVQYWPVNNGDEWGHDRLIIAVRKI